MGASLVEWTSYDFIQVGVLLRHTGITETIADLLSENLLNVTIFLNRENSRGDPEDF